mmetsp:Transcript_46768/g.111176  ORF Transcript_46768/g.111176 Transcript_46768/m.111176 type:complete len:131 (+) Transcript_46768:128-520(+)
MKFGLVILAALHSLPLRAESTACEVQDGSFGLEAACGDFHARHAQQADGHVADDPMLLATFMILRAAIALRSLYEGSQTVMWQGIAFACATRFIANASDSELELAFSGLREVMHVYGLRTVLRQLLPTCS